MDYIVVNDVPVPGFSSNENFLTISFSNTTTNGISYEWDFGDGNSSTDENPVHTYSAAGQYDVTLRATNECGTVTTMQTINVMANAVDEIPGISEFNVYPNPNDGRFTMVLRGEGRADLQVSFTNVLGQVILLSDIDFRSGNVTKEFSFNDLASGIYIFQVKSGSKALYRKVVVD
ncbi:MAG: PKD domain-containing protein [Saprospiraceae bacterium]